MIAAAHTSSAATSTSRTTKADRMPREASLKRKRVAPPADDEVSGFVRSVYTLLRVCDAEIAGWSADGMQARRAWVRASRGGVAMARPACSTQQRRSGLVSTVKESLRRGSSTRSIEQTSSAPARGVSLHTSTCERYSRRRKTPATSRSGEPGGACSVLSSVCRFLVSSGSARATIHVCSSLATAAAASSDRPPPSTAFEWIVFGMAESLPPPVLPDRAAEAAASAEASSWIGSRVTTATACASPPGGPIFVSCTCSRVARVAWGASAYG